jgi:hypothetical protein
MTPPRFSQTFAIRIGFFLLKLTAVLATANELSPQKLKFCSAIPRISYDYDSSVTGLALPDTAENQMHHEKYMEA